MSEPTNGDLAKWRNANPLRKFRKAGGISVFLMAGKVGCSPQSLNMWESGVTQPSDGSLDKIAKAMGMKGRDIGSSWDLWLRDDPFKRGSRRERAAPIKKRA